MPGVIYVSAITQGEAGLRYILDTPETNVEMLSIELSNTVGEDKILNRIKISLYSPTSDISDTDITNLRLYVDTGSLGTYEVADVLISGPVTQPSGMTVIFSNITGFTILENSITNLLLTIEHKTLTNGERLQAIVMPQWVEYYGIDTIYTDTGYGSTGYGVVKEVPGDLIITSITNGESLLKYMLSSATAEVELMQLRLSATRGEAKIVSEIQISLDYVQGIVDADITNIQLLIDRGISGTLDGSDIVVANYSGNPVSGIVTLSNISGLTINSNSATNVLVVLRHITLNYGDRITATIKTNWITHYGNYTIYTDTSLGANCDAVPKEVPGDIIVSSITPVSYTHLTLPTKA